MGLKHGQGAVVFAKPVGESAVKRQPVPIRTHAAITDQIPRILVTE
jgi:hypothetical protein